LFNNGAIALNVRLFQVVEHLATLADESHEGTLGDLVFLVLFHQLGEVLDAIGEQSNLSFSTTGILSRFSVLGENLFFLFFSQIHNMLRLFFYYFLSRFRLQKYDFFQNWQNIFHKIAQINTY